MSYKFRFVISFFNKCSPLDHIITETLDYLQCCLGFPVPFNQFAATFAPFYNIKKCGKPQNIRFSGFPH